ncbi:MAG: hypothetical protein ACPGGE_06410, partial [Poseidonia sp.]
MSYLIGDVIYFDANWAGGAVDLWAYNTSNNSGWLVKDINTVNTNQNYNSNPGELFSTLMGDTIYFSADSGNASLGVELWAHDTSNGTTWRVGYTNTTGTLPSTNYLTSYGRDLGVIDDTIYFQAWGSGGDGMWAYNLSNTTMWRIDISSGVTSSSPGECMALVVGDTLYFDADGGYTGRELWAHNHVNQTSWLVKDFKTSNYHAQLRHGNPGCNIALLIGDTIYLTASTNNDGNDIFAYNTSNHSVWVAVDIPIICPSCSFNSGNPGQEMAVVVGDTIYFDAMDEYVQVSQNGWQSTGRKLYAHDTSNGSTWKVYDFSPLGTDGVTGLVMAVGDTIYFVADDSPYQGFWAHDTSNQSTWMVENG